MILSDPIWLPVATRSFKNIHRLIEAAVKVVPVAESFTADVEAAIERLEKLEGRKPSATYKPSSMKCIRNMYFQIVSAKTDDERASAALIGIGESGTDRHERIQAVLSRAKEVGIDIEYIDVETYIKDHNLTNLQVVAKKGFETKLRHTGLNLSFMCDGIIKYRERYFIFEFKTESIYKWQPRTGVAEEHIPQAATYSVCFELDDVLFLYENRDNCTHKAYELRVTPDMKTDVVGKIQECDQWVSKQTPPPIPADITKKICQYCNYKDECKKAGT